MQQGPSNSSTGGSNTTAEVNVQKTRRRKSTGVFPRIPSALIRDEGPGSRPCLSTAGTLSPEGSVIV